MAIVIITATKEEVGPCSIKNVKVRDIGRMSGSDGHQFTILANGLIPFLDGS